jgi:hypothetical protein
MPAKRKYDTSAKRQAAYRTILRSAHNELQAEKGIPPLPPIATIPGHRRWGAMLQMASRLVRSIHDEMQGYFDERSESWQESDRADAFIERMDELAELIGSLESLEPSIQNTKENKNAS